MGEKIKDLQIIKIGNSQLQIELNHSPTLGGYRDIHIQNNIFRCSISEPEFIEMAAYVIAANKRLKELKKIGE